MDDIKDKDSTGRASAEHTEHASQEVQHQADEVNLKSSHLPDSAPVTHKLTRHGRRELIPQPSDDPRDPLNWSPRQKWTIFTIMIYGTFCGIATAVANVLATTVQAEDWGVTPTEAAYSISCVLAGIILGPVLLVPLVRVFGIMSCCFWSTIIVALTSIWSALSTGPNGYSSFLASRFIAGLFSATVQVFTSGVIADLFFVHQRGKAFAIYSALYMIAQVGGPTFSGYIVEFVEWPVCFWWTVGANLLAAGLFLGLGEDTNWDRENQKPIAKEDASEGSWMGRRIALFFPGTKVTASTGRWSNIWNSLKATFFIGISPVTILAGLYGLVFQGWFIMVGVQIPIILSEPPSQGGYGFSPLGVSNFYFSAWIGALFGVAYGILVNDRFPKLLQKRNSGIWRVEYRLHCAWLPSLVVGPIGCGIFGAALLYHWHYIVLALAEVFIVFAAVAAVPPQTNYIIEIWKSHPQEVSAALNVWRIVFAITVQFFYAPWVAKVGVQWVWGTAAFVEIWAFGLLFVLMAAGPVIRRYSLWPESIEEEPQRRHEEEDHAV
ncbi:Efflux pump radE [Pseudocercospora fuligena]|uniref:Efflux pump radE n=1 Tax=Pseudocercospora fuligena TaxID=685502 RepID=A0A8H6VAZ3_9PEZI|nr:Efflux pump radE [Pseudocercospora fuligena]